MIPSFELPDLPIREVLGELQRALATGTRAVVAAPPGSGKTTVIPLALATEPWVVGPDGTPRRIVMLEPRRLATRAAAQRMAAITGTELGGFVGYQTRDERRVSAQTVVEVVTEGILTRRLQTDPELPGTAAVIFDEVHERNLPTELGLAFVLDAAATLRPDLRILAMSATADVAAFAAVLGHGVAAGTPLVQSDGRMFDVDVRWVRRDQKQRLEDAMASTIRTALRDQPGNVLAFLPGIAEIDRTAAQLGDLDRHGIDVHRLAGSVATSEQDLALAPTPPDRRKVVLSTDIAETSLTVEGVRIVVDSGLAREPRFDVGTGMSRLTTVSISRDSAEQRSGRAGRTEPGAAYRLWTRVEHTARPARRQPELAVVDLAGFVLEVAAWGTPLDGLAFIQAPPRRAVQTATELLQMLGALDDRERITDEGRVMASLPVHPRLARMLTGAPSSLACAVAALVDERDIMRGRPSDLPSDLSLRLHAIAGHVDDRIDRRATARVRERATDLARRIGVRFDRDHLHGDLLGPTLLLGFPDRLAGRRRRGQFQLRTGSGAFVDDADPLAGADFVVAAELDGQRSRARIRLGAEVSADDVAALLDDVTTIETLAWDDERDDLVARVERRLDGLALGSTIQQPEPSPATSAALVDRVVATDGRVLRWRPADRALQARLTWLHDATGGDWPAVTDEALVADAGQWLAPLLTGATGRADLERIDVAEVLRQRAGWAVVAELDELAPLRWQWPSGRTTEIDYTAANPTVSVRVQDVFGTTTHPRIAGGQVPLTVALLSPADRPIQVTSDLPGFWSGSWAEVRKDLRGRYPKHRWPEDPAHEPPGRLKR